MFAIGMAHLACVFHMVWPLNSVAFGVPAVVLQDAGPVDHLHGTRCRQQQHVV